MSPSDTHLSTISTRKMMVKTWSVTVKAPDLACAQQHAGISRPVPSSVKHGGYIRPKFGSCACCGQLMESVCPGGRPEQLRYDGATGHAAVMIASSGRSKRRVMVVTMMQTRMRFSNTGCCTNAAQYMRIGLVCLKMKNARAFGILIFRRKPRTCIRSFLSTSSSSSPIASLNSAMLFLDRILFAGFMYPGSPATRLFAEAPSLSLLDPLSNFLNPCRRRPLTVVGGSPCRDSSGPSSSPSSSSPKP
mmetsp:Transcript_11861/g.26668  ORF Transcript_11861/g.26668 Transcript_11861/m.26668 type:complete len:247 (-) Transcript_11861:668-1408(-)